METYQYYLKLCNIVGLIAAIITALCIYFKFHFDTKIKELSKATIQPSSSPERSVSLNDTMSLKGNSTITGNKGKIVNAAHVTDQSGSGNN